MIGNKFSPWPSYTEEEVQAVCDVLRSNNVNYWTGNHVRKFEEEFAEYCGTKYAVAVSNGTVALELALISLDIGEGDEVVVTPRTFIASVSAIVSVGAIPVFADVDQDSQNITPKTIRKVISNKTKAIIVVHLGGWPSDMEGIMALADEYGLNVVEDCAQAHGALFNGKSVGSFGHIGAWSFCQDKIMTTGGEGGMVTTNDEMLWSRMWSYKDHGKSWKAVNQSQNSPGFNWVHNSFGTNWRMLEVQGVIGRIQLKHMPNWHSKRLLNAQKIWDASQKHPALRVPQIPDYIEHAAYKCYVFVKPSELQESWSRDRIIYEINALGVPCYSGSCPEVYLEKAFDNTDWRPANRLPISRELGETSLMFLVHPTLSNSEIKKTCDVITAILSQASL